MLAKNDPTRCDLTHPDGMPGFCTREKGHDGPCAFVPDCGVEDPNVRCRMMRCLSCEKKPVEVPQPVDATELFKQLSYRKLILMWEVMPNTDRFQQVVLTPEALGRIGDIFRMQMDQVPAGQGALPGAFIVVTNPDYTIQLDNIPPSYSHEEKRDIMRRGPDYDRPAMA